MIHPNNPTGTARPLLTAAIAALLVACGGGGTDTPASETPAADVASAATMIELGDTSLPKTVASQTALVHQPLISFELAPLRFLVVDDFSATRSIVIGLIKELGVEWICSSTFERPKGYRSCLFVRPAPNHLISSVEPP